MHRALSVLALAVMVFVGPHGFAQDADSTGMGYDAFQALLADRAAQARAAREASPFHRLSVDYLSRFSRDPAAVPNEGEVAVESGWRVVHHEGSPTVVRKMAEHLADFLDRCMHAPVSVLSTPDLDDGSVGDHAVVLRVDGSPAAEPESFTVRASAKLIEITGADGGGLRNGVVRVIGLMGLRQAPFLTVGETQYSPRVSVRIGSLGGVQNEVFYGCNAVTVAADLYALSLSDAIPELAVRRDPNAIAPLVAAAEAAREYDMGLYIHLSTVHKFPADDPVFAAHPEVRGALTWKADGDYTLCTEHPLVRQFLTESVASLFERLPDLDGVTIIIGGEGFYHCFMRAYGVEPGHTNCTRCEPLGAERVVANLCNGLVEAARRINPEARVIAWPYSASYVWSADWAQEGLMRLLAPGVVIQTELEKDEVVQKPGGIAKSIWDYSIDLIGPGKRAARQIEISRETGVPVHALTMAEMSFEAPLLPIVPVHDRWASRAEALASCGVQGVYLWNMAPFDGLSSAEVYQYKWFSPALETDDLLLALATRIAGGRKGGELLRLAWREASNGFAYTPEIGEYYKGPHYLGPAHPIPLSPDATLPEVFSGYYLFLMEMTRESGMKPLPTYVTRPEDFRAYLGTRSVPMLETYYRVLEDHLERAVRAVEAAYPLTPERCRMVFDAETLPIRWFYHTARTEANLFEVFRLTGRLRELEGAGQPLADGQRKEAAIAVFRLHDVLLDERSNVEEAMPIAQTDPRIDTIHRGDHSFNHLLDMLAAKSTLLDTQIKHELPAFAARLNVALPQD